MRTCERLSIASPRMAIALVCLAAAVSTSLVSRADTPSTTPSTSEADTVIPASPTAAAPTSAAASATQTRPAARVGEVLDLTFMREIDLTTIRLAAVQHDGRIKTFDSLARETLRHITGKSSLTVTDPASGESVSQDPVFTYLDMMFNAKAYRSRPMLQVKMKPMRWALAQAVGNAMDAEAGWQLIEAGLIAPAVLELPAVQNALEVMSRDIMRTAKHVDRLTDAAQLARPEVLLGQLRLIPPPGSTSVHARWASPAEVISNLDFHRHRAADENDSTVSVANLGQAWLTTRDAWQAGDAATAGDALDWLATYVPAVAPAVYPPAGKLSLESWYYAQRKMTWVWTVYLITAVLLMMGIVYNWRRARAGGIVLFVVAFGLHTTAAGIRWYLAGRIPNSNMFEAVTAAAWFGGAIALLVELAPRLAQSRIAMRVLRVLLFGGLGVYVVGVLARGVGFDDWKEWGPIPTIGLITLAVGAAGLIAVGAVGRRASTRGLPLLGAAVVGMIVMMCGYFMNVSLNSDISTTMPILDDLWLYIHTNMIITSYALIGIAFVTAAMYLVGRMLTRATAALWAAMLMPAIVMPLVALLPGITLKMILPAWAPFLAVIGMTVIGKLAGLVSGLRLREAARASWVGPVLQPPGTYLVSPGIARSMPPQLPAVPPAISNEEGRAGQLPAAGMSEAIKSPSQKPEIRPAGSRSHTGFGMGSRTDLAAAKRGSLARVLDGTTMLLMELSFITLWTGLIMGAIWADHSWGRPWGWDPKEVFALNTWIVFLVLVHVRMKVIDKPLWTAVLAVYGCAVMLFNWIVVNFFITGLHSYA